MKVIEYYDLTIKQFNMEKTFKHITKEEVEELKKRFPSRQFRRSTKRVESILVGGLNDN